MKTFTRPADPLAKAAFEELHEFGAPAAARGGATIDFSDPKSAALLILNEHWMLDDGAEIYRKAHFHRGEFWLWNGAHYAQMTVADLRALLYREGHFAGKPLRKRHVDDVIDALRAVLNLSDSIEPPCWLQSGSGFADPRALVPMKNGVFDVSTRSLLAPTPAYLSHYSLPFPFESNAPPPVRWNAFLHDVWGPDEDSKALLRQWFGYCLLPSTEHQKMLMLVGPIRSGKGTIIRVLQALLGRENTASPTLGSLAQPFGLAPLVGKLLAVVSDVRLSGRVDIATVVENLLRISGEDAVTIPRKYLADLTLTLSARMMLVTNEIPWFADSSGAIASRFLVLQTSRSFFDQEDVHLTEALIAELPSIFAWALDGLDDLRERGRFLQPESGIETRDQMSLLASPVRAFVDARCEVGDPTAECVVADLFKAWTEWSAANGYKHSGTAQTFGRDLRAVLPGVRVVQHRVTVGPTVRHYEGISLRNPEGVTR